MGTGVTEAVAVAGLFVLSTILMTRVMTAESSRRVLGSLLSDRESAPTTFRVPRGVLVATGIVAAGFVGFRVAEVVGCLAAIAVSLAGCLQFIAVKINERNITCTEIPQGS